jgi:hypothetical protein
MNLLIERIIAGRMPKTRSIFDLHHEHHKQAQVDTTSFQAQRLGLKYLGFGRYGKIMMPAQQPTMATAAPKAKKPGDTKNLVGGQMMVTHIVRNGLLVPVSVSPPENNFYPNPTHTDHSSYQRKRAEKVKEEVKKLVGWKRGDWNRGLKALQDYVTSGYTTMNAVLQKGMLKKAHPTIINKINSLDKLFQMDVSKVHQDMPVYMSTGLTPKKGDALEYTAYLSTALCPKIACGLMGGRNANPDIVDVQHEDEAKTTVPSVIQIDLKKGQRALDVVSLTGGPDYNDKDTPEEFILPRQSRLIITDGPIYLKHAMVWRAELDQTDDDFTLNTEEQ